MKFNLNDAAVAERDFTSSRELIPEDTEALLLIDVLRSTGTAAYDAESNGWLHLTKSGESAMLKLEFTVIGGEFNRRKFWENLYVRGDSDTAIQISLTKLRSIVDGALGLNPHDKSPAADKKRQMEISGLNKLEFSAVIGVEKGAGTNPKTGEPYPDKNVLKRVLNDAAPPNGKSTVVASAATKPAGNEKRKAAFAS